MPQWSPPELCTNPSEQRTHLSRVRLMRLAVAVSVASPSLMSPRDVRLDESWRLTVSRGSPYDRRHPRGAEMDRRFHAFFGEATTCPPYGYQARAARDGLPAVVQAPTGASNKGIKLPWLSRRPERTHP